MNSIKYGIVGVAVLFLFGAAGAHAQETQSPATDSAVQNNLAETDVSTTSLDSDLLRLSRVRLETVEVSRTTTRPTELPEYLCWLTGVKELKVSNADITKLPGCLTKNMGSSLEKLTVSDVKIHQFGSLVDTFRNLRELHISEVDLATGNLLLAYSEMLEIIEIENAKLGPNSIFNVHTNPNLKRLVITGNNLGDVLARNVAILGGLTNLRYLDLSNNGLTEIPAGLPFLINLETLDLSGNPLTADQQNEITKLFANHTPKVNITF